MQTKSSSVEQPTIVHHLQMSRNGIQATHLTRHAIGYVVRGHKYLYEGDIRHQVVRGELFYLEIGTHYVEDIPEPGTHFEQIVFYYTSEQLSQILNQLTMNYGFQVSNDHHCERCNQITYVSYPAWGAMQSFYDAIGLYLRSDLFAEDRLAEQLKITELIYLILSHPACCLKGKILGNIDSVKESFEQLIRSHVFDNISIDSLAQKSHRSLTSFKKEFRRHFYEPPHKWFIRQRLMHSRLLLISTNKSVSEVGSECNFPNTSHFIKLFKKAYGLTPATYRHQYDGSQGSSIELRLQVN